ncbi:MAG: M28 family peptidase [bacterium]|nr:M28 family peptidase [bacterium]
MKSIEVLIIVLLSASNAIAYPLLQAVPCDGYGEVYEYARDGIEVVAVGAEFCIVRYDSSGTAPIITAGAVELGPASRYIYIVESYSGAEWTDKPGTELLARFGDSYIVAVETYLLTTNWAGRFEIRKVHDRPIQAPKGTQDYPPIEENALVREMVNRIYVDDYGDFLEGLVDVTPTRYTPSPLIEPATGYIENYFTGFGLKTQRHAYELEGSATIHTIGIFRADAERAWVSSSINSIWRTIDGGDDWSSIPITDVFQDFYFFNPQEGFAVGYLGISITHDGGLSWSEVETGNLADGLYDIDFYNEVNGAACGISYSDPSTEHSSCIITDDGGQSWNETVIPIADELYSVCRRTPSDIWIGGGGSRIYRSTDGGISFVEVETSGLPPNRRIYCIDMFDAVNGVVAGPNLLAYTEDGGSTWQRPISNPPAFNDMFFVNNSTGWVCGDSGIVLYTDDSGHNWTELDTDSNDDLYGISALSETDIWVSANNNLFTTTDGGSSWQTVHLPAPNPPVHENVIAEKTGNTKPEEIYIICAHYDSTSDSPWLLAPGAEDNGSGTAGVLHLAKIMSQYDFASTIRFCAWSGEEQGLRGSYAYATEAFDRGDDIRAVYNMDMIAYMDDDNYDTAISYVDIFEDILTACQEASGIYVPQLIIYPEEGWGASDHASFWNYGYPAIMAIEYDGTEWYPWYHSTEDTYDHLRYDYGVLNVKLGAALIGFLAEPLSGPNFTTADVYAYPNPIRPDTDFVTFANVPDGSEIEIYTITGDKVATVYERNLDAYWNLRNDAGGEVASGVYLYYLDTGTDTKIGKIAVIH